MKHGREFKATRRALLTCPDCWGVGIRGRGQGAWICPTCVGTGFQYPGACMCCYGVGRIVVGRRRWYIIGPIEPRLVQCPSCGGSGDRP